MSKELTVPKVRQSNIELLRCIAMLLIIMQHFGDRVVAGEGMSVNDLFCNLIKLFGTIGVNCFVLISGYFMINQSFKPKKLIVLYYKIFIYGLLLSVVLHLCGYTHYGIKEWFRNCFPILTMRYWYLSMHMGLCLISPFLNKLLKILSKKEYFWMLSTGFLLFSLLSMISIEQIWVSRFIWFIYLYSLAAYIRLYPEITRIKCRKCITVSCVTLALLWGTVQALKLMKRYVPIIGNHIYYFSANWYVFDLIISLGLFIGMLNLDITNKYLNTMGKSTLGVYVLHSTLSPFEKIFHCSLFASSPYLAPYCIFCTVIVFMACSLADQYVEKFTNKYIMKYLDLISEWIEKSVRRILDNAYKCYFN